MLICSWRSSSFSCKVSKWISSYNGPLLSRGATRPASFAPPPLKIHRFVSLVLTPQPTQQVPFLCSPTRLSKLLSFSCCCLPALGNCTLTLYSFPSFVPFLPSLLSFTPSFLLLCLVSAQHRRSCSRAGAAGAQAVPSAQHSSQHDCSTGMSHSPPLFFLSLVVCCSFVACVLTLITAWLFQGQRDCCHPPACREPHCPMVS